MKPSTLLHYQEIANYALSNPNESTEELSSIFECNPDTIWWALNKLGIKRGGRGNGREGKARWVQTVLTTPIHVSPPAKRAKRGRTLPYSKRISQCYNGMKDRCLNTNNPGFKNWGGRGIIICQEWLGENGIINFFRDMK